MTYGHALVAFILTVAVIAFQAVLATLVIVHEL